MAVSSKYYVVWKGHSPGIFSNWADCEKQIKGFPEALYKSFPTYELAVEAFSNKPHKYFQQSQVIKSKGTSNSTIISESISVDGACNQTNGKMEYRGVHTGTKKQLFHIGPLPGGSNNLAEFLALVHALALCKQQNWNVPIYSDSKTALAWLRYKKAKTTIEFDGKNTEIQDMVFRAEKWLKQNTWENQIIKWETDVWGEIPADFGRK